MSSLKRDKIVQGVEFKGKIEFYVQYGHLF